MTQMDLGMSERVKPLVQKVRTMVQDEILAADAEYHAEVGKAGDRFKFTDRQNEIREGLKAKAKKQGLWNFWLTDSDRGYGLSTVEYAYLAEEMGWCVLAPEVFNCSAPDTGNMEVLERYGTEEHKKKWLGKLLEGEIRSAFLMTEPDVASSDATNLEFSAVKDGDEWVFNGEKYWSSGAGDPRCEVYILMARTAARDSGVPRHGQHSMYAIDAGLPGVEILRPMTVFGHDDAPHGHMHIRFTDVRVPASALLIGEGRGFEVSQGRLGPGRIHHCMLKAAWMMDQGDARAAAPYISQIKVAAPNMALKVIDEAMQMFGGTGVSQDTPLADMYAGMRTLRFADGPDAVHRMQVARKELKPYTNAKV